MNHWFSEAWPGAGVAVRHRPVGGRTVLHFLTDLAVSVSFVLACGWLFQASAGDAYLREALVTQNEVYVAISRFTAQNLFVSYLATIDHMTRDLIYGFNPADGLTPAVGQALATVGRLVLDVALAAPYTLAELYWQTSGTAAWIVLAGFGMTIGTVLAWLFMTRLSLWRLLVASAVSPVAVSVVFLVLQAFMVLMLEAFLWLTALAPYAVACPVICTLYWVAFPNADRGATYAVARAIGLVLDRRQG
jgi:hypothetical protein